MALTWALLLGGAARAEDALRPVTLPGLRVPLPAWPTLESTGDFTVGRMAVKSPDAPFRAVSVMWQRSTPTEHAEVASLLGGTATDARAVTVGGHRGETFRLVGAALPMVVTHWYCPVDERAVMVVVAGEPPDADLRRLAAAIVPNIACHTIRPESRPLPLYPSFDPPRGFKLVQLPGNPARKYADADQQLFVLNPGMRGQHVEKDMMRMAKIREAVLVATVGLQQAHIDERPRVVGERRIWQATGMLDGKRAHVLATVFECGDDSFLAQFLGYSQAAADNAVQVLAHIGCPAR